MTSAWPFADGELTALLGPSGFGKTTLRTVILPSVRMSLIGSTLLLFVFLLGTYVAVTVFTDPAKQTTAISIYEAVRGANLDAPFGAAQAVVLLVTATVFLTLGHRLTRRAEATS